MPRYLGINLFIHAAIHRNEYGGDSSGGGHQLADDKLVDNNNTKITDTEVMTAEIVGGGGHSGGGGGGNLLANQKLVANNQLDNNITDTEVMTAVIVGGGARVDIDNIDDHNYPNCQPNANRPPIGNPETRLSSLMMTQMSSSRYSPSRLTLTGRHRQQSKHFRTPLTTASIDQIVRNVVSGMSQPTSSSKLPIVANKPVVRPVDRQQQQPVVWSGVDCRHQQKREEVNRSLSFLRNQSIDVNRRSSSSMSSTITSLTQLSQQLIGHSSSSSSSSTPMLSVSQSFLSQSQPLSMAVKDNDRLVINRKIIDENVVNKATTVTTTTVPLPQTPTIIDVKPIDVNRRSTVSDDERYAIPKLFGLADRLRRLRDTTTPVAPIGGTDNLVKTTSDDQKEAPPPTPIKRVTFANDNIIINNTSTIDTNIQDNKQNSIVSQLVPKEKEMANNFNKCLATKSNIKNESVTSTTTPTMSGQKMFDIIGHMYKQTNNTSPVSSNTGNYGSYGVLRSQTAIKRQSVVRRLQQQQRRPPKRQHQWMAANTDKNNKTITTANDDNRITSKYFMTVKQVRNGNDDDDEDSSDEDIKILEPIDGFITSGSGRALTPKVFNRIDKYNKFYRNEE